MSRIFFIVFLFVTGVLVSTASAADDLTPVAHQQPVTDHAPVVLVNGQRPQAVIVFPKDNSQTRAMRRAAIDLQSLIESSTGAKLPIVETAQDVGSAIFLQVVGAKNNDTLKAEGFTIRTAANAVYIIGNDPAGLSHGIYDFLERSVGVRFYWPVYQNEFKDAGTYIPSLKSLVIEPTHYSDAPVFPKRHRYPSGGPRIGKARMFQHDQRLRCGNSWPINLIVHAPHGWSKLYKDTRPEIFQLRGDGQRDWVMLCYGNPMTLQTYIEEIEFQLAATEPVGRDRRIVRDMAVTVSPADMTVACRCEDCQKLWNPDGGTYETASRVLGSFVAQLGRAIQKRWPELTVIYLPYKNYTYAPEGLTLPSNVEVQLCGMPGLALYKDKQINATEQANIDAWVRLTGRPIQNWHYSCWPANRTDAAYLFPHTVAEHYRANRDKTVGTFINGVKDHWPRQHLSLYVWLKVLWNPDIDVDAVIDGYCRRMYGPAAGTMKQLVGLLIDGWEKSNWSTPVLSPTMVYEQSYPRQTVLRIQNLFEQARQQARDNERVTRRLNYYAPALHAFFAESKLLVEGEGIKPLNMYQVAEDPKIDGRLDDAAWRNVTPVSFIKADGSGQTPVYPTALKAVWSWQGVTFGFKMTEPDVDKLARDIAADSRDASLIWWNDNVEIFIDPTGQRTGYYQLIINANGAMWTSIGREDTSWEPPGVLAATHVSDGFWSLEVFVPYTGFKDALRPGTGVAWFGNFTRHRVTDRSQREYQGYNVTTGAPSHNQNAFGPMKFIER